MSDPSVPPPADAERRAGTSTTLAAVGGIVGVIAGYVAFRLVLKVGLYGLVLPGALAGVGCAMLGRRPSTAQGVVGGVLGLLGGILAEWHVAPFLVDDSLGYFLAHLGNVRTPSQIMIAAGAILGFLFARSRKS